MLNYKNFVAPRGDKAMLLRRLKDSSRLVGLHEKYISWRQVEVAELIGDAVEAQKFFERWTTAISKGTGRKLVPGHYSFIMHYGCGNVPSHTDRMSASCYLVPLLCTPTVTFQEEYRQVAFAKTKLIRFNDSNTHSVRNPHSAAFAVMSITRDRV